MGAGGEMNLGGTERAASAALGVALAVAGLLRGRATGALMAAAGGALLYRGTSGRCPAGPVLGRGGSEGADRARGREVRGIDEPWQPPRGADRWAPRVAGGEAGATLGQTRGPAARRVDEEVEETFPASDAPAFAGGTAVPGAASRRAPPG